MSFDDDLDAALNAEVDFTIVPITLRGKLYRLRFDQMPGTEWVDLCDGHPARLKSTVDRIYGYNIRAVVQEAAPKCGYLLEGEKPTKLTIEQWTKLFDALPGDPIKRIGDALFDLNQYSPGAEVEAAKKEFEAGFVLNSASPANSESHTDDSPVGNLEPSPDTSTGQTDD